MSLNTRKKSKTDKISFFFSIFRWQNYLKICLELLLNYLFTSQIACKIIIVHTDAVRGKSSLFYIWQAQHLSRFKKSHSTTT